MANPFNLSDEEDSSRSAASNAQSSTTAPVLPHNYSNLPQFPQIDNEALVEAFYVALCRCAQAQSAINSNQAPPSPFVRPHHWQPLHEGSTSSSTSSSVTSSPRNSFRENQRTDSNLDDENMSTDDDEVYYPQLNIRRIPQSCPKNVKKPKEAHKSRFTNFVISALQFVIDTLKVD